MWCVVCVCYWCVPVSLSRDGVSYLGCPHICMYIYMHKCICETESGIGVNQCHCHETESPTCLCPFLHCYYHYYCYYYYCPYPQAALYTYAYIQDGDTPSHGIHSPAGALVPMAACASRILKYMSLRIHGAAAVQRRRPEHSKKKRS
jgi:hypothetical protein